MCHNPTMPKNSKRKQSKRNSMNCTVGRPNVYGRNATLHCRLKMAVRARLEAMARADHRSLSDVVNIALENFVKSATQAS